MAYVLIYLLIGIAAMVRVLWVTRDQIARDHERYGVIVAFSVGAASVLGVVIWPIWLAALGFAKLAVTFASRAGGDDD